MLVGSLILVKREEKENIRETRKRRKDTVHFSYSCSMVSKEIERKVRTV